MWQPVRLQLRETRALVVAEEHLGAAAAYALAQANARTIPVRFVNLGDRYAESGDPDQLMQKYGMTADQIVREVRSAV